MSYRYLHNRVIKPLRNGTTFWLTLHIPVKGKKNSFKDGLNHFIVKSSVTITSNLIEHVMDGTILLPINSTHIFTICVVYLSLVQGSRLQQYIHVFIHIYKLFCIKVNGYIFKGRYSSYFLFAFTSPITVYR